MPVEHRRKTVTHLIGQARQLDPASVHVSPAGGAANYHGLLV